MMRNDYGAIVIGGGYFGCACSYFLAKAGVPTLLLDEKEIGRGGLRRQLRQCAGSGCLHGTQL